jgi:glyoxylase-like metal-dependent hydrolase (beta-lactamase superfamily II)
MTTPAFPVTRWHSPGQARTMRLGDFTLTHVIDGVMALDPRKFVPAIPAAWWSAHPEQLNADGRMVMAAGGLLVESAGNALLIDLGWGQFTGEHPFGQIDCGRLLDSLASAGHEPSAIDDVAFTHLHIDHMGWATPFGGSPQLVFGRARHWIARAEWLAWTTGPGDHPGTPSPRDYAAPLAAAVHLFDAGQEVVPGVRAMPVFGHSPGHTAFVIEAGGARVIAFGDAFHVPAQISHPEWCSPTDGDRDATIEARHRLLEELSRADTIGFGCHFADVTFGRVARPARNGPHEWRPTLTAAVPALASDRRR